MPAIGQKFEIGERVSFDIGGIKRNGEIGGVSFDEVIAVYIVILDEPIAMPGHTMPWKAMSIQSSLLRKEERKGEPLNLGPFDEAYLSDGIAVGSKHSMIKS